MEKKTSQASRVKVSPIATKFWENVDDVQEEEQVNLFEKGGFKQGYFQ